MYIQLIGRMLALPQGAALTALSFRCAAWCRWMPRAQATRAALVAIGLRGQLQPQALDAWLQAAEEAAISRLYGGIHFPSANKNGLEQGRCIAGHILELKTRA